MNALWNRLLLLHRLGGLPIYFIVKTCLTSDMVNQSRKKIFYSFTLIGLSFIPFLIFNRNLTFKKAFSLSYHNIFPSNISKFIGFSENISSDGESQKKQKFNPNHIIYSPPPMTDTGLRPEIKTFCRRKKALKCLIGMNPCAFVEEYCSKMNITSITSKSNPCCFPNARSLIYDIVSEHADLSNPTITKYIKAHTHPDSAWIALARDPVDQYISWFKLITSTDEPYRYSNSRVIMDPKPILGETVAKFHDYFQTNNTANMSADYLKLFHNMHNLQARYYGWIGTKESLIEAIERLESYAFVGLVEEVELSWTLLKRQLNISNEDVFNLSRGLVPRIQYIDLEDGVRKMIETLQYADMEIYRKAKILFERQKKEAEGTVDMLKFKFNRRPTWT